MEELRKFEELLAPKLGPNKKIVNIDITKPPPSGVGSLMLKVKATVKDENGEEELLHLVAKKIPAGEFARKAFDIQKTFKKEVAFYEVIVPILKDFQQEEGIKDVLDNFAEFYGARFSLDENSDIVDEDAVMVLEDLSVKGFGNGDRTVGFGLNSAKKILQDLAKFHGTTMALKLKKPDVFNTTIKPLCTPFDFSTDNPSKPIFDILKELIETFPDSAHLADIATNFLQKQTPTTYREPYDAIIHFDLWVNNILNKVENDEIVKNVFVDFQVYGHRSHVADMFFFIWSSVQRQVLAEHLDSLLSHYHEHLLKTLSSFQIDTTKFSFENFEEEIRIESHFEFGHALIFNFFLKFVKEFSGGPPKEHEKLKVEDINTNLKESIHFMVKECHKRGWLY